MSELVTTGLVAAHRAELKNKKRLQEQIDWQLKIKNHPSAQGDERVAEVVYELDLRPSDDEISNIKKVLDHLDQTKQNP